MLDENESDHRINEGDRSLFRAYILADATGGAGADQVLPLIDHLATLPAEAAGKIQRELRRYYPVPSRNRFLPPWTAKINGPGAPPQMPLQKAWLEIFAANGYRREAALTKTFGTPPGPAFLAGLVLRLNDHVPQVRRAAEHSLDRIAPDVPDNQILALLPWYFRRRAFWIDFPSDQRMAELTHRPGVRQALRDLLLRGEGNWMPRFFKAVVSTDIADPWLEDLARGAFHPAIRARAARIAG